MKYLLNTGLYLFASISVFGQTMQASIGAGSSPARVIVYIKPTTPVNGFISTFQFDVSIDASINPAPTVSIIGAPAFGISWYAEPPFVEDGFRHYEFISQSNPSISIGAGVETAVIELQFSGGPVTPNSVSLQTLGNFGGITGNSLFYFTGAASSVEGQLYYTRPGTTVINNLSYSGPLASSATLGGIVLPIKWLSFDVIKQGDNALLNWSVANENTNHHYEVLRSSDGINYSPIATVNRSTNGSTTYNYTDIGINDLNKTILYYRIRQVDIDGRSSLSDIRFITIDKKQSPVITIYPNPVTEGFYVSIPFEDRNKTMVTLKLVSANGQFIGSREITTTQASNYYFNIKDRALSSGDYYLQIIYEGKTMETKKLTINR